jgi:hypothetical protein
MLLAMSWMVAGAASWALLVMTLRLKSMPPLMGMALALLEAVVVVVSPFAAIGTLFHRTGTGVIVGLIVFAVLAGLGYYGAATMRWH